MTLESLKISDPAETVHQVFHIVELLQPWNLRETTQRILSELEQGGETHDQEHDVEEMLAGSGSLDPSLTQLHLQQALISLATGDIEEAKHHVIHAQEQPYDEIASSLIKLLQSPESENMHDSEHGLQELPGQDEHHD